MAGVVALRNEVVIGMGRLVGDGVLYCSIQELIVLSELRGVGIGKVISMACLVSPREIYASAGRVTDDVSPAIWWTDSLVQRAPCRDVGAQLPDDVSNVESLPARAWRVKTHVVHSRLCKVYDSFRA